MQRLFPKTSPGRLAHATLSQIDQFPPSLVEKAERRLFVRVDPVYPQDLKRFYIGGTVRLKLLISARGTVESVSPLGGNPVLLESSIRAVKKWRYAPADNSTETFLNLVFYPRQ